MAVRVTTKMMQGTSLSNLNTNKALQEKLNIQMSTLKKITRPSDDPVIAIRSLRLNCTLTKVEQYHEKNSKDAAAWLKLTDDSIETVSDIITNMKSYMTQDANDYLETSNREAIVENLKQLAEEIYSVGNADYEGRSIFTGYRTGEALTFQKDQTYKYSITEQLSNTNFDTTTFVSTGDISAINSGNFNEKQNVYEADGVTPVYETDADGNFVLDDDGNQIIKQEYVKKTTEYDVGTYEIHRMRLAYSNVDTTADNAANVSISYGNNWAVEKSIELAPVFTYEGQNFKFVSGGDGTNSLYVDDGTGVYSAVDITKGKDVTITGTTIAVNNTVDANGIGTLQFSNGGDTDITMQYSTDVNTGVLTFDDQYYKSVEVTNVFKNATDEAYKTAVDDPNAVVYIAETGEVLFGEDIYNDLSAISEDREIRVSYDKSSWSEGDINPINYFSCTDEKGIVYNSTKLYDPTSIAALQTITYDVGDNQKLQVNTNADEVFTHDIGRDIEELTNLLDQLGDIQTVLASVQGMIDSGEYHDDDLTKLEEQKEALSTAQTYIKDKTQAMCESYQTKFDNYLSQCNLALTKVGSRAARQELVDNRLGEQKTTFKTLVSDNEDADLSELAVQLSSVELTYKAALSSISYLMKTTLLDYL